MCCVEGLMLGRFVAVYIGGGAPANVCSQRHGQGHLKTTAWGVESRVLLELRPRLCKWT